MTKTQQALDIIRRASADGKTAQEAADLAAAETGLGIYCEAPLTPERSGKEYYDSVSRHNRHAMFHVYARRRGGKFGRQLACEFVHGFAR